MNVLLNGNGGSQLGMGVKERGEEMQLRPSGNGLWNMKNLMMQSGNAEWGIGRAQKVEKIYRVAEYGGFRARVREGDGERIG